MECGRCGAVRQGFRLFCACGRLWSLSELRQVNLSTDDDRGRALDEMHQTVEAGKAEFDRDLESKFVRDVEEHYRQVL